jgi:hypothetical protein
MKARARILALACTLCAPLSLPSSATAQMEDDLFQPRRDFRSPENFAIEFRFGPYHPDLSDNDAFDTFFADDDGLLLALELDVFAYRLPDIVYVGGGGGIGWADYDGNTLDQGGSQTSEETELEIVPLNLLAVVRIDALARKLSVPFVVSGKLGYQWAHWSADSGGADDESGWAVGLLWGAQLALDLDFFEPSAARAMDEEWGINHSLLFFELFGFEPSNDSLPIGDLAWTVGLAFTF